MGISKFRARQFVKHVQLFMGSMQLINFDKSVLVAVSGGVDSIALMYVLADIFKGQLRVLHINHGTRVENIDEENLVIKHCKILGLEVDIVKFTLNLDQNNFEAVARNLRAEVYKQYIQKNYWVHTAHHLDDSFEWSMIQSFKQSSLASTLGIPVFNRGLVRPFMCASKNQIRAYAKSLGLTWAEDSSNRDTRFERNFFRANLTETIHKRYPQYLCHYVARQNQLALQLNLHRSLFLNKATANKSHMSEKREASGAMVLRSRDFSFHKHHIKEWIHFFSKTHRGEIDHEVDKLILAHKKVIDDPRALKMKGPLSFSGGVKIFILNDCLLICNDLHLDYYQQCDELLLRLLEHSGDISQITDVRLKNPSKIFFPYLCFLRPEDRNKSSKLTHPLLPKSTLWLKQRKIPYSFYPLISRKSRQKIVHTAVILDSSALGL
ncbi:MAG: tRNA lysidine(34) synthetase TilS [Bacteriovorax sp.]|nr:tRNA lysidine(34) synthetase TilS [Bacteriovorax sp.]